MAAPVLWWLLSQNELEIGSSSDDGISEISDRVSTAIEPARSPTVIMQHKKGLDGSQEVHSILPHAALPSSVREEEAIRETPPPLKKIRPTPQAESRSVHHEAMVSPQPPPSQPVPQQQQQQSSSNLPPQMLCVRWGNYDTNLHSMFTKLLTKEHFVDVTLACEGRSIRCHKVVLSACSSYFEQLLTENPCPHPIIFMKDLQFWEVQALVDFMYKGEVNVPQEKLPSLLKAAECLQVKGLGAAGTENTSTDTARRTIESTTGSDSVHQTPVKSESLQPAKRRRTQHDSHDTTYTPNSNSMRRGEAQKVTRDRRAARHSSTLESVPVYTAPAPNSIQVQPKTIIKMEPEDLDLDEDSVDSNHFKDDVATDDQPDDPSEPHLTMDLDRHATPTQMNLGSTNDVSMEQFNENAEGDDTKDDIDDESEEDENQHRKNDTGQ